PQCSRVPSSLSPRTIGTTSSSSVTQDPAAVPRSSVTPIGKSLATASSLCRLPRLVTGNGAYFLLGVAGGDVPPPTESSTQGTPSPPFSSPPLLALYFFLK
ncbi:hypothetical protein E2562_027688, partial [Oryza meyeriana var. granulata]